MATSLGERKLNSNLLNGLKIDLVSQPVCMEGSSKYIYPEKVFD